MQVAQRVTKLGHPIHNLSFSQKLPIAVGLLDHLMQVQARDIVHDQIVTTYSQKIRVI